MLGARGARPSEYGTSVGPEGRVPRAPIPILQCLIRVSSVAKAGSVLVNSHSLNAGPEELKPFPQRSPEKED